LQNKKKRLKTEKINSRGGEVFPGEHKEKRGGKKKSLTVSEEANRCLGIRARGGLAPLVANRKAKVAGKN